MNASYTQRPPLVVPIRSLVVCLFTDREAERTDAGFKFGEPASGWMTYGNGPFALWFQPRNPSSADGSHSPAGITWLLGDTAEWDENAPLQNLVNAVPTRFETGPARFTASTSIVGLPPLFLYQDSRCTVVASDIYLIARLPWVRLELDPVAVEQLGRVGHAVGHRTLFKNTQLLPSGSTLSISAAGGVRSAPSWQLPRHAPLPWPAFIETQIETFTGALARTDVSRTVLSMTAGLDTRTVFATLAHQGRLVPGTTMTGVRPSLDARTARALCRTYGVDHQMVVLGDDFVRDLPRLVEIASRLSGGLESLEQAPEVYFNEWLVRSFGARLSGNLGNQVGRGGTEGVGLRNADTSVLGPAATPQVEAAREHWLLGKLERDEHSALSFILQQEIPFSSVANFSVGSHFAVQQSPYASRQLLETLAAKPSSQTSAPSGSLLRMRLRDLNHRFLGEPATISFQRTLLTRIGGAAAHYPINYGWRATGGISPRGAALGLATLLGMIAQKTGLSDRTAGRWVGAKAVAPLHNFRSSHIWLRQYLRDFTYDVLGAVDVRSSGLFELGRLDFLMKQHFQGTQNHHETLVFALDVALAFRQFCRRSTENVGGIHA